MLDIKEQLKMYRENRPQNYRLFIVTKKGMKCFEISRSRYLEDGSLEFRSIIKVKKKTTIFGYGLCDLNKRVIAYKGYLVILFPIDTLEAIYTIGVNNDLPTEGIC